MTRLVVDPVRLTGDELVLEKEELRYLRHVRRLSVGDPVTVRDGHGGEYPSTLQAGRLSLGPRIQLPEPAGARVALVFAPPKGRRMDVLLEKATEIGAADLHPVYTARSVRKDGTADRWSRIVRSAATQCQAAFEPTLHAATSLDALLADPPPAVLKLIADPTADTGLATLLTPVDQVAILTGPEGGFTDEELTAATTAGWQRFSLGPNVLRAETAPLVALTVVRHVLGDLG